MDTLLNVLSQQLQSTQNIAGTIQALVIDGQGIVASEIPEADKKTQIKSLMASATIQMISLNSQDVLVQQTIDKILELVNE